VRKAGADAGSGEDSEDAPLLPCRGLCLPGLGLSCSGDPGPEDEAQPPTVLRAVALLHPGFWCPSVPGGG
jgi:hypothetical protein